MTYMEDEMLNLLCNKEKPPSMPPRTPPTKSPNFSLISQKPRDEKRWASIYSFLGPDIHAVALLICVAMWRNGELQEEKQTNHVEA